MIKYIVVYKHSEKKVSEEELTYVYYVDICWSKMTTVLLEAMLSRVVSLDAIWSCFWEEILNVFAGNKA